jgi:hypothetical protein
MGRGSGVTINVLRISAMAWAFILAGWSADGAEVRLRPEAMVAGSIVRLSDIAEIGGPDSASLEDVRLFPAPGPGKERIVRRGEIAELLVLSEVDIKIHPLTGADRIVIRRTRPPNAKPASLTPDP